MQGRGEESLLVRRLGRRRVRGLKYTLLAVPFMVYIFAMNYVPLIGCLF